MPIALLAVLGVNLIVLVTFAASVFARYRELIGITVAAASVRTCPNSERP